MDRRRPHRGCGRGPRGGGSWLRLHIIVGIAGAIIGGYLLGALFNVSGTVGFFGGIVVAFLGAAVLLAALKLLSGGRL